MGSVAGRAVELALLESACREVRSGAGRLVLLTGEAGIGKSFLAGAAAEQAAASGMVVARGWCVEDPAAPLLWPWRRVARDVAGLAVALEAADRGEPDNALFRLVDDVVAVLTSEVGGVGLTVVIEDLHWADSLSLDLLRLLLPEIAALPVLLLATAREDGLAGSRLGRVASDLLRAPGTLHVPLSGLTPESVETWLVSDPQTAAWVPYATDLVRLTGGNPFYIHSLTSELVPEPGFDLSAALVDRPTWRTVLAAPYRSLSQSVRSTVATAAVLGEQLSSGLLAEALSRPITEVSEELRTAVASGILRPGDAGLAFRHALVRDAIIADLEPDERAQAHTAVAMALEARGPLMAGTAAVHWSRVEGADAAARCRDLATTAAARHVLAPDRGVQLARLALEAARALGANDDELAERTLVVARFEWAAGMLQQALATSATGLDLAEAASRPDLIADFALVPQGASPDVARIAGGLCRRALDSLPVAEVTRRARLLALYAVATAEVAQSHASAAPAAPSADELSAAALAAAEASGDNEAKLEAIAARHYALSYPHAIADRSILAARAVELASSAATTMGALWGHLWEADLAFQRGDFLAVEQAVEDIDRVAVRRASPVAAWHALRLRATLGLVTGRFAEARALALQARVLADRAGDIWMVGMQTALQVHLGLLRGDPSEIPSDSMEVGADIPPLPVVRSLLPLIHGVRGDLRRARAEFASLRGVPAQMPLGPRWFATVLQIAYCAVLVRDPDAARQYHGLLAPCAPWCYGDGSGSPNGGGSNEYILGLLAETFADLTLAADHFAQGIAVDDRTGASPYAALGRLGLSRCLAAKEAARASALASDAEAEFQRLDMPGPLAQVQQLRQRLGERDGERRSARSGGLSAREMEVAQLVGRALTNQQIAEQLFLSVRTVESHVRNILAKLSLTSRTEIIVWVRDQDASVLDLSPAVAPTMSPGRSIDPPWPASPTKA